MPIPKWDETTEIESQKDSEPSWDNTQELPSISKTESGLRGVAQGASFNFADEITGAAEGIYDDLKRLFNGDSTGVKATYDEHGRVSNAEELNKAATYEKHRDESRANYKAAQDANPVTYGAGEIGGAVGASFIPGLSMAKGASLGGRLGTAAAQGGLTGLGQSEADNALDLARDTAVGAGLGAGFQGGGELVAKGISKLPALISNKTTAKYAGKAAALASGVDEDAAARQLMRPAQQIAAEADDFSNQLGKRVVSEVEDLGSNLGKNVDKAKMGFYKSHGEQEIQGVGKNLADSIDNFLDINAPSQKGFSALDEKQIDNLANLSKNLRGGELNGEDLVKVRDYLDQVERLANKYGTDTGPYTNFLKSLRGQADSVLDRISPEIDSANSKFAQFKSDTSLLRSATNEGQSEKMITNLYGANKGAQQEAAGRLLNPETLEQAKDIAANKAFANAKGPAGSEFGLRRVGGIAAAIPTGGLSMLVTSPNAWKHGLRGLGKAGEKLGKFGPILEKAAQRGPHALAATHFVLQQTDPQYRQTLKDMDDDDGKH